MSANEISFEVEGNGFGTLAAMFLANIDSAALGLGGEQMALLQTRINPVDDPKILSALSKDDFFDPIFHVMESDSSTRLDAKQLLFF